MRYAANKASTVKGDFHGNDPNYRCVSASVRRWRRILGSQSRLLVIDRVPKLEPESECSVGVDFSSPAGFAELFLCNARGDHRPASKSIDPEF